MSTRMVPLLSVLKFNTQDAEGLLCNLHQKYVRLFFFVSFTFSISRQLFGESIICFRSKDEINQEMIDAVCLINGTFSRNADGTVFHHNYYQWISTVLLLEALSFSFPIYVFNKYYGFYIDQLKNVKNDDSFQYVRRVIETTNGNRIFTVLLLLECFYAFHLLLQGVLLNAFFNNGFSFPWNVSVFRKIFPDHGLCWFSYYAGGGETTGRYYCTLPLNALYRKIFFVAHFGFWFLVVFQTVYLSCQIYLFFLGNENIHRMKSYEIAAKHAENYEMKILLEARTPNVLPTRVPNIPNVLETRV